MSRSEMEELMRLMQLQLSREPERHQQQIDVQRELMERQADAHNRQMEQMMALVQSLSKTGTKATHGNTLVKFVPFNPNAELWSDYFQRFKTFLVANSVPDEKKAHVFLTNQTSIIYKQLSNLASQQNPPKDINELTFQSIIEFMNEQYHPKRFLVRERFKFWKNIGRESGENIQGLVARTRQDAATCDFPSIKDPLDDAMRTRFICSVDNENILKALFKRKDDDLTFSNVIEIAQEIEEASFAAEETVHGGGRTKAWKMNDDADFDEDINDFAKNSECIRCGQNSHSAKNCPFQSLVCYACNQKGHMAKMCPSYNSSKQMIRRKGRR